MEKRSTHFLDGSAHSCEFSVILIKEHLEMQAWKRLILEIKNPLVSQRSWSENKLFHPNNHHHVPHSSSHAGVKIPWDSLIQPYISWLNIPMWPKQCHKPGIWEWFISPIKIYKNGDFRDGLFLF